MYNVEEGDTAMKTGLSFQWNEDWLRLYMYFKSWPSYYKCHSPACTHLFYLITVYIKHVDLPLHMFIQKKKKSSFLISIMGKLSVQLLVIADFHARDPCLHFFSFFLLDSTFPKYCPVHDRILSEFKKSPSNYLFTSFLWFLLHTQTAIVSRMNNPADSIRWEGRRP